jgi:hypothetical protein
MKTTDFLDATSALMVWRSIKLTNGAIVACTAYYFCVVYGNPDSVRVLLKRRLEGMLHDADASEIEAIDLNITRIDAINKSKTQMATPPSEIFVPKVSAVRG